MKYTFTDLQKMQRIKNAGKVFTFNETTTDIEFLDLKGNTKLKEIRFESPQNKLRYIDASYCSLKRIVFSENCEKLQTIYLHHNQLKSVEFKGNFINLQLLDLSYNESLEKLIIAQEFPGLTHLFLNNCNLKDLSNLANYFRKPDFDFNIEDNPNLKTPPLEIVKGGKLSTTNYFSSFLAEDEDFYLYEARILILGEAGAGKTTLARKILDPKAKMPEEKDSTKGIDVTKWEYTTDSDNGSHDMRVNIWDFGGQSIYKATHRFFLSNRVLYVLLTDGRKEDTDFNYWLNLAEMFGGNSPVLIVMNSKEGREYNIPLNTMRGRFSNLKDEIKVNLKEIGQNHSTIINKLKHYLSELPHIGNKLPKSWTLIRNEIENLSDRFINHRQFFRICEKHGISELDKILQISQFFHDIGVFLHFIDDPLLGKILFLKNDWALDAAYAIIDNPTVKNQNGHFSKTEAASIWGKDYYMVYDELLALMKRFYLIYEIKSSQQYISPQLLPNDKPDYNWDEKDNLQLRYEYDDFMPQGILWQFIAIMHKQIKNQKLVWRSGVILAEGETEAEITEVYGQHKINIRIKGRNKLEFRTIIAYELDKINNQYSKLKFEKFVPCICKHCTNNPTPYFFIYSKLKEIAQRGKRDIEFCGNSDEEVSVKKLLDGIEINKSVKGILNEEKSILYKELTGYSANDQYKNTIIKKALNEILFICSSPKDKNPLDFGAEFRKIKDAKAKGSNRDSFNIEIETGVEADELINKLTQKPYPDIIHISMHASKSEGLYFEDKNKNEKPISADELAEIFDLFSEIHQPELVILSACNSINHAQAIKPYAKYIVGTTDFLPDEVAIIYANRFYEMLFDGKTIDFAHKAACLSIKQAPIAEEDKNRLKTPLHKIPVLLTQ